MAYTGGEEDKDKNKKRKGTGENKSNTSSGDIKKAPNQSPANSNYYKDPATGELKKYGGVEYMVDKKKKVTADSHLWDKTEKMWSNTHEGQTTPRFK